ncbi:MAG: serine/threonine-protein kinase [Isosphaeraceae bacterium]
MSERAESLRDLIFVMYALKTGLLDRSAIFDAFVAWDLSSDTERSLVDFLITRGILSEPQLRLLERMVVEHLRQRGGRVDGAIATIEPPHPVSTADTVGGGSKPCDGPGSEETLADKGGTLPFFGNAGSDSFTLAQPQNVAPEQRFEILSPHAEGGLGVVSVAFDHELKRQVALKRIKDRHADDPVSRSRFLMEAEVTGGLEHPGVVPVYGLGLGQDGRPYYAMRFIHGGSLKDAITAFHKDSGLRADTGARGLELRKLLRRLLDVCNTVEYAHGRGVIHRDIKPANIMVGPYGETLLVDWGIAKAVKRTSSRPEGPEPRGDLPARRRRDRDPRRLGDGDARLHEPGARGRGGKDGSGLPATCTAWARRCTSC